MKQSLPFVTFSGSGGENGYFPTILFRVSLHEEQLERETCNPQEAVYVSRSRQKLS